MQSTERRRRPSDLFRRPDPSLLTTPIHCFRTAARLGSIRAAAEYLHLHSSAVSRHIAKLETALGTTLFERLPRGLRLSSSGEVFLYHTRESLNQIERARAVIDDMQGLKRGHVSIVTTESVANGLLPTFMMEFWKQVPAVSFSIRTMSSLDAFNGVHNGEFDIALGYDLPEGIPLRVLATARLQIGAIISSRHPLAKHTTLRLRDLAGEAILLPDDTVGLRALLNPYLRRYNLGVEPRVVSSSLTALEGLAALNAGVLIQTRIGLATEWLKRKVTFVRIQDFASKSQKLQLCVRSGGLSPSANAVAQQFSPFIQALSDA